MEMHLARHKGMDGPMPLSYSEIASWAHLHRIELEPYEATAIKTIDMMYLNPRSKQDE